MTFIVADRVQETTNSPGTGTATLLGAVSGYQSFSTGIGANNTTFYVIADQLGTNWEVGLGALNATGTVLTRTTVYSSSNGGGTVNFATGTQYVWCDFPASKSVLQGAAVNFSSIGATTAGTGAFTTLSASSTVSGTGFSNYFAAPPTIGNTTPNAGTFTNLTYTGTLTGGTGVVNLGSGQFYKDASGNIGIGTASPAYKLDVTGITKSSTLQVSGTGVGAYSANAWFVQNEGTSNTRVYYTGADASTFGILQEYSANSAGSPSITRYASNVAQIFYTNNAEAVRIDGSQNVGIGTASPVYKLTVGNSDATAQICAGGVNTLLTIAGMGSNGSIIFGSGGVSNGTPGIERARINYSGAFFVRCTANPVSARTIGFGANGNASGGIQIYQGNSNSDWGINATSGSICNFYSDTGSALVYSGSISVNGNITTYGSISDYRLKENIVPLTGALEKIAQLKPVTFDFKDSGQSSQGFIAHELQEVVPDCVTGKKDAVDAEGKPIYQGIDTSFLVATLTAAIQEQQAIIETMKAKLKDAGVLGF